MVKKAVEAGAPVAETPVAEKKKAGNIGRPKLTPEQIADRDAKKKGDTRDSVRIYFTPLQYAYLKEYHAQGGHLPGETIRHAVDFYFEWLIKTERYEPTVTPKSARLDWEARQGITKAHTDLLSKLSGEHTDVDYSDEFPARKEETL